MHNNNVDSIVNHGLCTSCGICVGACANHSIEFKYGKYNNYPGINWNSCVNCGMCLKVCPGKGAMLQEKGKQLFPNALPNKYCGRYINAYVGYSYNEDVRYHSASGGMVTQFLIYLLNKKIVDGAVVVRYSKKDPFEPEPFIATSTEELLESRSSKYIVVSYDRIIDQIKKFDGRLVVVGLPCHIQGIRNVAEVNKKIKDKIIGYFGIYCSLNKTKKSISYYRYRYGIRKEEIVNFSFRDDGCMGSMKFVGHNGIVLKKIPYLRYWNGTKSFFMNDRCALCNDHFAELADISFGDIHIEPYSQDKVGISSLVTRSNYWDTLLRKSMEDEYVKLDTIDVETLVRSQKYSTIYKKGRGLQAELKMRKWAGKYNPIYDDPDIVKPRLIDYVKNISRALMRYVGKHNTLWPLIKIIDR